jgi:hypothetical protein
MSGVLKNIDPPPPHRPASVYPPEIDTIEKQQTEKIEMEVRDDDRIQKHTGVRNIIGVSFWGIPFTQYHLIFPPPPCQQAPSRKETPRWRILYRITRQLLHHVSTATVVSSRAVSTSTVISGCFQPGQAKVVLGPTPLGGTTHSLGEEGVGGQYFGRRQTLLCTLHT